MKLRHYLFVFCVLSSIMAVLDGCYYDVESELYGTGASCTDTIATYNGSVKKIVNQYCATASCHAGVSPSANIGLDTYSLCKTSASQGEFYCSINWNSGCSQMPKNASKLSDCQINTLNRWKTNGFPEN
ncbi:MAG: hypothetical protein ACKOZY_05725 [Flavobacteriales bacterium]